MNDRVNNFFEMGSNPLVRPEELIVGYIYATDKGDIVKVMSVNEIDESVEYSVVQRSEMVEGELITNLDTNPLNLFWRLTKNNASKTTPYENDTN